MTDILFQKNESLGEYVPDYNDRLNYISNFSGSFNANIKEQLLFVMEDILCRLTIKVKNILKNYNS